MIPSFLKKFYTTEAILKVTAPVIQEDGSTREETSDLAIYGKIIKPNKPFPMTEAGESVSKYTSKMVFETDPNINVPPTSLLVINGTTFQAGVSMVYETHQEIPIEAIEIVLTAPTFKEITQNTSPNPIPLVYPEGIE